MSLPVLIVGAGPTGLNLALRLKRHGVAFRIIDQASGPGTQSRALAVQARTLEFYRQVGLADRVVAAGVEIQGIRMREAGEEVARVSLTEFGEGLSPYPIVLDLPQDEHERLLVDVLAAEGVQVEWNTSLEELGPDAEDGVEASLVGPGGPSRERFAYIAGCDGARSRVREARGVRLGGGTYERLYYVADVKIRGPMIPELVLALDKGAFALRLPSRKGEDERLIGFVPDGRESNPTFEDARPSAERLLDVQVEAVNWFSTYRVHHRVADHFRVGRAFLLGDAGHLHSPVGGQGMNTGIGDAVNLSWKLAQVLAGRAPDSLLDTYEAERIAFARDLVSTTDRVFRAVADTGLVGRVVRSALLPHIFPAATSTEGGRRMMFRLLSQIHIHYAQERPERGARRSCGGRRPPAVDRGPGQLRAAGFPRLAGSRFRRAAAAFEAKAKSLHLALHRFDHTAQAGRAGFENGAAYLVRPDGYIALAMQRPDIATLDAYIARHGLSFG